MTGVITPSLVPSAGRLELSALQIALLILAVVHGNAVSRRLLTAQGVASAIAFLAGVATYLAIWLGPIYNVRPWGLSQLAFSFLAFAVLLGFFAAGRDYVVVIAALASLGPLGGAAYDAVTGRPDLAGRLANIWVPGVVLGGLLFRSEIISRLGLQRAWRWFRQVPDSSAPGVEAVAKRLLEAALSKGDHLLAGTAKILIGRCRYRKGDVAGGVDQVLAAEVLLRSAPGAGWRAVALVQLAEWTLQAGPEHADEAAEAAANACSAASQLARARQLRARSLIDRAITEYQLQDEVGALRDAYEAKRLLRGWARPRGDRAEMLQSAERLAAELGHAKTTAKNLRHRIALRWLR